MIKLLIATVMIAIVFLSLVISNREHFFGYDEIGEDLSKNLLKGVVDLLGISLLVSSVSLVLALMSSYLGSLNSRFEIMFSTFFKSFYGIPPLLMLLIAMRLIFEDVSVRREGMIILSIFVVWGGIHNSLIGRVRDIVNSQYFKASISLGQSYVKSLVDHVIPNSLENMILGFFDGVRLTMFLNLTVGFLGFGVPDSLGDLMGTNFLGAIGYLDFKMTLISILSPLAPFLDIKSISPEEYMNLWTFCAPLGYSIWILVTMRLLRGFFNDIIGRFYR